MKILTFRGAQDQRQTLRPLEGLRLNVKHSARGDGKHEHGLARGKALREAENYAPVFASTIHEAWKDERMSRRRLKPVKQGRRVQRSIALPCVVVDCAPCKKVVGPVCLTNGQHIGERPHRRSCSCPEVRVDYVPRTRGHAMAGGYTPWQTSFEEDDPPPGHSSSMPPPNPPPRGPRAQPSNYD